MKTKVRIALAQMEVKQFDVDANKKKIEEFVKRAKGKADIIVFPEYCVTGPIEERLELADRDGSALEFFKGLAKKNKLAIVAGSFVEEKTSGKYNTAYFIDERGKAKGQHEKINLWLTERDCFSPGNRLSTFYTKWGKAALSICWDLTSPLLCREYAKQNVKIIFCPSYWEDANWYKPIAKWRKGAQIGFVNSLCEARAYENNLCFVFCNAVGSFELNGARKRLLGRSQITLPVIGKAARIEHNREELLIKEIDLSVLRDAERSNLLRRDIKQRIC